ncbi:MAG: hypothetical protein IH605_06225 [Burkholderiales bacterium]|nr:hypothetical protein [Burkholderiales bacterium]
MNMQTNKHLQLSLLGGGIAAVLVSGIAIASVAFSAQGFSGVVAPAEAPEAAVAPAIAAPVTRTRRCAECGVIESVQEIKATDEIGAVKSPDRITVRSRGEIEAKSPRIYEITIRMQDGSMRVIADAKPARWRHGEPVTIIAGLD